MGGSKIWVDYDSVGLSGTAKPACRSVIYQCLVLMLVIEKYPPSKKYFLHVIFMCYECLQYMCTKFKITFFLHSKQADV